MNFVVNLNKDKGITSHSAVTKVKKLFKVKKAGHAGTLDPLATGVLLVCFNEATKITGYLSDLDKEYIAILKLGETTDTFDSEGKIIKKISNFKITVSNIKEVIGKFIGDIKQTPPIFSAIKVDGKPLYDLARKGIEVEIKPRIVSIYSIELVNYEQPFLTIKVSCSKGTYIRSLCNDIGNELHVGAHMISLIRTKIGHFTIENSAKLEELPVKNESLYTVDDALRHMPYIEFTENALLKVKNGNSVREELFNLKGINSKSIAEYRFVRLKDYEGRLFGIGKRANGWIKPERLFNF